jgi:aspartate aminotransferase
MSARKSGLALGDLIQSVEPSPTLSITALAASLRAQGHDIISLSAGQPDFDTPDHIKEAAKAALDAGRTKYEPVAGIPALREAVAKLYRGRGLSGARACNVVVSTGAKHCLYGCMQVLLDPGDECIIPVPYWVSYPAQVRLARGRSVFVETRQDDGFKMTPDALRSAVTERTRLLILNSPSNPTGAVYTRTELEGIADICLEHRIGVLWDSIYDELIYGDGELVEFSTLRPGLEELTITINGLSKSHAMTGWRLGYLVAPEPVAKAVAKLQSQSTSNATSITQWAALAAIEGVQEPTKAMKVHFDRRRRLMVRLLRAIPSVECLEPMGAFYAFPDFSRYIGRLGPTGLIEDDVALCNYLLETHGVALVPGSAFGSPGNMRLSYATDDTSIERGIGRIAEGLLALQSR